MPDDSDRIIPDPAPAEPKDVQVNPDPPAREPFDVPTFPDSPPKAPFDVSVSSDPGPTGTFDVPTSPDPAPKNPFDVPINPDRPPAAPFDVPTTPDSPPRVPFDVPTTADPAPKAPFDVPLSLDGPPAVPFNVQIVNDPPPAVPFQVQTVIDSPPGVPFDVAVTPSSPPRTPFNVQITYDPPALNAFGLGETPTIQQIIDAVGKFDRTLGSFLNDILEISPIIGGGPGDGALDPSILAQWLKDYKDVVGAAGIARFVNEQAALYGMNTEVARIFDPSYFLKMLIPGSMGHANTTIDVEAGLNFEQVAQVKDLLVKSNVQLEPDRPGGPQDVYGPADNTRFDHGQDFSVDELVLSSITGIPHPFLKDDRNQVGLSAVKVFDDGAYAASKNGLAKLRVINGQSNVRNSTLAASAFLDGVIRVPIGANEDPDGCVYSQTPDPSVIVDDDDTRVPLCFTDLRRDPVRRAYRSVYFRPLNLGFSTQLSPDYAETNSFGRVDNTVGYQKTTRTVEMSFEVHCMAVEDLQVAYSKLTWLESMCYPTYTPDSLLQSGPVIRLRIGDAISTSDGGLPGVIKSLGVDFADTIWELERGMKVPRSFKVNVSFMALHDGPVGILNGQFGVFRLPPTGLAPDKDTNYAGGPTDSRTDSVPQGISIVRGGFSKFGEPRGK